MFMCLYVIKNWFLSTFFGLVTAKVMYSATKTGVPDNKDCNTLSSLGGLVKRAGKSK